MSVLLGLLAALGFGGGDFLGGYASRRSPTLAVLLVGQAVGLVISVGFLAVDGFRALPLDSALAALGAGVTGATGLGLLFRGLATGVMGVVAPVSAVLASVMPVGWGLLQGERPSWVAGVGVVVAVVAVALVAQEHGEVSGTAGRVVPRDLRPLALALGAGVSFGFAVVLFSEASGEGGFWPLLLARAASVPGIAAAILLTRHRRGRYERADTPVAVASGVSDVLGNAALIVGFRRGLTSLVSPIAALYPAATVLLARVVLGERMRPVQRLGLVLALVGLVLIGAG